MRIALCLSGHMRSYRKTYQSIRYNIIDPYSTDVFISTWDRIGADRSYDLNLIDVETSSMLKSIEVAFRTKNINIEKYNGKNYELYPLVKDRSNPIGVLSMFYNINKADELRRNYEIKHKFKYDVIIRSRPDILFTSSINRNHMLDAIKSDAIYFTDFAHWSGFNDQFAFGSNNAMTQYADCFNNLKNIIDRVDFNPEVLLKEHVLSNNLNVKFTNTNYFIKRADGYNYNCRSLSDGIPKF